MIVHNMMKSIDQIVERLNKQINNTQGSEDEILFRRRDAKQGSVAEDENLFRGGDTKQGCQN